MGVVVGVYVAGIHRDHAAGSGNLATHVLELHRRVVNTEPVPQYMFEPMEDMIALRWRHIVNQHVAAQRV